MMGTGSLKGVLTAMMQSCDEEGTKKNKNWFLSFPFDFSCLFLVYIRVFVCRLFDMTTVNRHHYVCFRKDETTNMFRHIETNMEVLGRLRPLFFLLSDRQWLDFF